MKASELPAPLEAEEQMALFQWAQASMGLYPELYWLFHVPNGEKRDKITAAKLARMGVKSGVPDIFLLIPRDGYHGLVVELKRKGGKASPEQMDWLDNQMREGYCVAICEGWETAKDFILKYLRGTKEGVKGI